MIEAYFPTLPKIELNRRGPPRPEWSSWGYKEKHNKGDVDRSCSLHLPAPAAHFRRLRADVPAAATTGGSEP